MKRKIVRFIIIAAAVFLAYKAIMVLSLIVFPLPVHFLEKDYSRVFLASNDELLRISLSGSDKYRVRLNLSDMSEYVKKGFIAYEDKTFYYHFGINPYAVARAFILNMKHSKRLSGASTITMQVAKMMEPKKRTILSKCKEIFRALQIEHKYSKKEIFELYLNMVPMGGNIEGIGAASYFYFGKSSKHLSIGESAILIGMPKSPAKFRPDKNPALAMKQRNLVLKKIKNILCPEQTLFHQAVSEKIPLNKFSNPFNTPNLVMRVSGSGNKYIKKTSIDVNLQKYCEKIISREIKKLREKSCNNAAVIVLDNKSMEVLAYIGTADFNDEKHGGQINCANILRSPGSLLKPFLYAKAVDKGVLTPNKIVFDIQRNYDGYIPANFKKNFQGPITAIEALVHSLNVPAVNLEFELKREGLSSFIEQTHFYDKGRQNVGSGLSLALGAYPMTLEELVRLYSVFANNGKLRELNFFKDNNDKNNGFSVLSPEACFIITSMLCEVYRPDLPQCWEFTNNRGRIAFKTGTSFGLRDAWCIGYNPDYTVGVWFGNADCKSSFALVGMEAAAPVTTEIFNHLTRHKDIWFVKPESVGIRKVCAVSGEKAGKYCKKTISDYYIPGISDNSECSVHRQVYIRKSDGKEVCIHCMDEPMKNYITKIIELWPPDVSSFLRIFNKRTLDLPKHNEKCNAICAGKGLKIKNPMKSGYYAINKYMPLKDQKIKLQAESDNEKEVLYWFVNGKFLTREDPDKEVFIEPVPGSHIISVCDSKGRSDKVEFKIYSSVSKPKTYVYNFP